MFWGLTSCSTIEYRSRGTIPVFISPRPKHHVKVEASGTLKFYLCGLIPQKQVVNVDKDLSDTGIMSATQLELYEFIRPEDLFWSLLTFGVYTPKSYRLSAYGIKNREFYNSRL